MIGRLVWHGKSCGKGRGISWYPNVAQARGKRRGKAAAARWVTARISMVKTGLTVKQQRFCEEYLVVFNATAAYQRSGYRADGPGAAVNAQPCPPASQGESTLTGNRSRCCRSARPGDDPGSR
jgi:hypothetical protein